MSFADRLATLAFEVVGVLVAVGLVRTLLVQGRPRPEHLRLATAMVIGALGIAFAIGAIPSGASLLNQARRQSASAREAVEDCFHLGWPGNPNGAGAARLPFVNWLKAQMGPHAVYDIDYAPPPDANCLFLALLPALPATRGEHAQWTIAFGVVPSEMLRKIANRDTSVRVFGPGLALQANGGH